jgi:hypothetical protein
VLKSKGGSGAPPKPANPSFLHSGFVIDSSFVIRIFAIYRIRVYSCSLVVAKRWRFKLDQARQRFRLTSTEKRVIAFVLAAFVLGLVTKCYRDAHPSPAPAQSDSR